MNAYGQPPGQQPQGWPQQPPMQNPGLNGNQPPPASHNVRIIKFITINNFIY